MKAVISKKITAEEMERIKSLFASPDAENHTIAEELVKQLEQ